MKIYRFLLEHMNDSHKFQLTAKLTQDVGKPALILGIHLISHLEWMNCRSWGLSLMKPSLSMLKQAHCWRTLSKSWFAKCVKLLCSFCMVSVVCWLQFQHFCNRKSNWVLWGVLLRKTCQTQRQNWLLLLLAWQRRTSFLRWSHLKSFWPCSMCSICWPPMFTGHEEECDWEHHPYCCFSEAHGEIAWNATN